MSRVLIVGGTGMLRPATRQLIADGHEVVVVARHPERAVAGTEAAAGLHLVSADWQRPAELVDRIAEKVGDLLPDRAILWVHDPPGQRLHDQLGRVLTPDATVVRLLGSATHDPARGSAEVEPPPVYAPPRDYRTVVLGFEGEGVATRWLTDEEISGGALAALSDPRPTRTVGRTEPWSDRP